MTRKKFKKDYSRTGKSFSGHRDFSKDSGPAPVAKDEQDMSEQGED